MALEAPFDRHSFRPLFDSGAPGAGQNFEPRTEISPLKFAPPNSLPLGPALLFSLPCPFIVPTSRIPPHLLLIDDAQKFFVQGQLARYAPNRS